MLLQPIQKAARPRNLYASRFQAFLFFQEYVVRGIRRRAQGAIGLAGAFESASLSVNALDRHGFAQGALPLMRGDIELQPSDIGRRRARRLAGYLALDQTTIGQPPARPGEMLPRSLQGAPQPIA